MKRSLFLLSLLLITACTNQNPLTIMSQEGTQYLEIQEGLGYFHIYNKSSNKLVKNTTAVIISGNLEYYSGLVKWSKDTAYIYHTYGIYENTPTSRIVLKRINSDQFEDLKKDTDYTYFYFPK